MQSESVPIEFNKIKTQSGRAGRRVGVIPLHRGIEE